MSAPHYFQPLELRPYRDGVASGGGSVRSPPPPPPPHWGPLGNQETETATTLTSAASYEEIRSDRASSKWTTSTGYDAGQATLLQDGGRTPTSNLRATYLERKTRRFAPTWLIAVVTLATAAVTVFYAARVMLDKSVLPRALEHGPGTSVLIVNVLSHLVAFLCLTLFMETMEALRWSLACRRKGFLLTSFLAMSRATPLMGVLYLCRVPGSHQWWAVQRFASYVADVTLSLILITNVTFRTVYTIINVEEGGTAPTKAVVAGLAPVSGYGLTNISLALVPILATSYSIAFITDPRFVAKVEPVHCSGPDCLSIFLPGGMDGVRFYTDEGSHTLFNGQFDGDYDTIIINDAPGYQIEYGSVGEFDPSFQWSRNLIDGDCALFLQSIDDGLYLCKKQVGDVMLLGWTICPEPLYNARLCQNDTSWTDGVVRWNTTVSMFSRRATVAYDRQNVSIVSVEAITEPVQIAAESEAFALYCAVIMSSITNNISYSGDPKAYGFSSSVFAFGYGISFILRLYLNDQPVFLDGGRSLLRSFVAVPFQFSTIMRQYGGKDQMPPENHVTASLAHSSYRAFIDPWMVWVFASLAFVLTAWCVVALVWITFLGPCSPNLSFFPEINIASKSSVQQAPDGRGDADPNLETADDTLEDLGRLTRGFGLGTGMSSDVISSLKGKRVFCGSMAGASEGDRIIVLVTEGGRLKLLNEYERYS